MKLRQVLYLVLTLCLCSVVLNVVYVFDDDRLKFESLNVSLSDIFNRSLPCSQTTKCLPSAHTKVILLTYMRSGSSFTGDILSAHPDVFYVYEPLHYVGYANNIVFHFLRKRKVRDRNGKAYMKHNTITGLMDCDFGKIDIGTLTGFHMTNSRSTRPYSKCLAANLGIFGLIHCLPTLYQTCYKANVILAKTIRLSMKAAGPFMLKPEVKIVHLVRDPRATIWSEGRYGEYKMNEFRSFVRKFCNKLLGDLRMLEQMKVRFPKRTFLLLYENLAYDPIDVSKTLYKFMNLSMTGSVTEHVRNITMSGHEEKCPLCISRADSAKSSQEWRLHLTLNKSRYIDRACAPAYDILGYKRVDNEDNYRNISLPLHSWPRL